MSDIKSYFDSRINKTDNCWLWIGPKFNHGYGCIAYKKKERRLAHRISWEIFNGEIPENLNVLHKCDVRLCVNPNHLFLGTQEENVHDMIRKKRDFRGLPQKGSKNPMSKLTENDISYIRSIPKVRGVQRQLAQQFSVSEATISLIYSGGRW